MSRSSTLAKINSTLASFDDERLSVIAELIQDFEEGSAPVRQLSPRERDLLGQSKRDFANGRTLSQDELVAELDERLAKRGVPKSKP